jgi:2-polyprenyl-3-methyl-5-hydroxy-6-metoxy-1,4-benzoquinol methylase
MRYLRRAGDHVRGPDGRRLPWRAIAEKAAVKVRLLAGRPRARRAERDLINWNVKVLGYRLAEEMAQALPAPPPEPVPAPAGLASKACVQADIESAWFAYWAHRLKAAPIYHRKLWEFCFILQALHEAGALRPGARAVGFGCGEEPLPSLFASLGMTVLATDAPPALSAASGWAASSEYAGSIDSLYKPEICGRAVFDRLVKLRHVDMNRIPADLAQGFDIVWSACALEHLGSIARGLGFIEDSARCLAPGGIAVHTTEWNFASDRRTRDDCGTVLFQRRHFEAVASRLAAAGFTVAPLDFSLGSGVLDRFIDVPPYSWGLEPPFATLLTKEDEAHLKLSVEGFAVTSFGLVIRKPA